LPIKASKTTLVFIILSSLLWFALPARANLSVDIQPREIYFGETVKLRLVVDEQASSKEELIEVSDFRLPSSSDFQVVSQVSSNTSGPYHIKYEAVFELRPTKAGTLLFPPVTLEYRFKGQNRELLTEAIPIQVKEKQHQTEPSSKIQSDFPIFFTLLCVLAVPIFLGFMWYMRRKNTIIPPKMDSFKPVEKSIQPISKLQLDSPLMKIYRDYQEGSSEMDTLEKTYTWFQAEAFTAGLLPYAGATSAEIISFLSEQRFLSADLTLITQFLDLCQSLRYSGQEPDESKMEMVFDLANKLPFQDRSR